MYYACVCRMVVFTQLDPVYVVCVHCVLQDVAGGRKAAMAPGQRRVGADGVGGRSQELQPHDRRHSGLRVRKARQPLEGAGTEPQARGVNEEPQAFTVTVEADQVAKENDKGAERPR